MKQSKLWVTCMIHAQNRYTSIWLNNMAIKRGQENYRVKGHVTYSREPACSKGVGQDHLQVCPTPTVLWFCVCLCILEEIEMLCDMLLSSGILIPIAKPACITIQKIEALEIISSPRISPVEFVAEESSAWHCSESHCFFFHIKNVFRISYYSLPLIIISSQRLPMCKCGKSPCDVYDIYVSFRL